MCTALIALIGACVPSSGMAAGLRSHHFPGTLYAVGCETPSLCVLTGHNNRPAGTRVLVVRNGRVIGSITPRDTDYGNNSTVSCPSRHGCVAALPLAPGSGALLATVDAAGRITTQRVRAPQNIQFNAISCVTLTSCELVGLSNNGGIAMATWNGRHRGPVSSVVPRTWPPGYSTYGLGNDLPTVSCSASQCEVTLNFAVDPLFHDVYRAFLVHLRHGRIDRSGWASDESVYSLSCGTNRLCWAIVTPQDGSAGLQLATIEDGILGRPRPLNLPGGVLACWGFTCAVAEDDRITTLVLGKPTGTRIVAATKHLSAVAAGPNGVFAAVGTADPSGSVFAVAP